MIQLTLVFQCEQIALFGQLAPYLAQQQAQQGGLSQQQLFQLQLQQLQTVNTDSMLLHCCVLVLLLCVNAGAARFQCRLGDCGPMVYEAIDNFDLICVT